MSEDARVPERGVMFQREQVLKQLVSACCDGRLTLEETLTRVESAHRAASYSELRTVTEDLPGPGNAAVSAARRGARRLLVGCLAQSGRWPFPALRRKVLAMALFGEVVIDLRRTRVTSFNTQITAVAIAGEVLIIVPDGFQVQTDGKWTIAGYVKESGRNDNADSFVPVVRIATFAFLGDVRIAQQGGK